MNTDQLFSIVNLLAVAGWLLLIVAPYRKFTQKIIFNGIIMLLAVAYAFLIIIYWGDAPDGGFSSLEEVSNLFENYNLLLAGWIHYLAFDLLAGLFIVNNARQHSINRWIIIPCLLLTFLFGPCGLLLFVVIRSIRTKNYFVSNF